MTELKLVFAGSPQAAVPSLRALAASRHQVRAVITREDSPQGRKRILAPTVVARAAEQLGVELIKANRLSGEAADVIEKIQPDLGVIVAYGGLVREPLLSAPRLGWVNLHFSLLPRWRGAAPVHHAIMAGDDVTGASVFQLVPELDAGDIFGQVTQSIGGHESAGHLLSSLAEAGSELLVRVVDAIAEGTARSEPQYGDVTLAPKLHLQHGRIDFAADAATVVNLIRGVTPEPGAFTEVDGIRLKIGAASIAGDAAALPSGHIESLDRRVLVGTATRPIELISVQPAGKTMMTAADWWRGRPAVSGTVAE